MYCSNCGNKVSARTVICMKCGCALDNYVRSMNTRDTSYPHRENEWLTTLLLCLFLGGLGIHRFYTRNYEIAVVQLVLFFCTCGIVSYLWDMVDLVLLCSGNYTTDDGRVLRSE